MDPLALESAALHKKAAFPLPTLKLTQKGLILILVPLCFGIVSFVTLFVSLEQTEREVKQQSYARSVLQHFNDLTRLIMDASSAMYVYILHGKDNHLVIYRHLTERIPEEFRSLHELLDGKPEQAKALVNFEDAIERALTHLEQAKSAARKRNIADAFEYVSEMKDLSSMLSSSMNKLSEPFSLLERESTLAAERSRHTLKVVLVVAIVLNMALAMGLYIYFNRDTARRMATLLDNTVRFLKDQPLNEPLSGDDEFGHLDRVFHHMAESISIAMKEKQEFMAMVTHDIRSPLTGVVSSIELLEHPNMASTIGERAMQIITRCGANVHMLLRLADDLLEIDKLEAGKMKMHFEDAPLAYPIERAQETLQASADQRQVKIDAMQTEAFVWADGDRLVQVMVNLLSNALKYSPANTTIRIEVEDVQDPPGMVEVRVVDQGPGIPDEYKDRMFQRFQQVDLKERQKYGGTGLGLAICREIIHAHHGDIGIRSSVGQGSTFWFRLPKAAATG